MDEIAAGIDERLTREVSQLPLLPKNKNNRDNNDDGSSGEETLMRELRSVYKKNLDVVEAYCRRNVFTLSSFDKTKRRKVLDAFLTDDCQAANNNDDEQQQQQHPNSSIQQQNYDPPDKNEALPTPQQIVSMDREILEARHRLREEKRRGHALSAQISRLNRALSSLSTVHTALGGGDRDDTTNDDTNNTTTTDDFNVLAAEIQNAIDGHEEIKGWNDKAERVICLLDKIKAERGGGSDGGVAGAGSGGSAGRSSSAVGGGMTTNATMTVCRNKDEKERRRVWEEMNGEVSSSAGGTGGSGGGSQHRHGAGSSREIATLLKKLREK